MDSYQLKPDYINKYKQYKDLKMSEKDWNDINFFSDKIEKVEPYCTGCITLGTGCLKCSKCLIEIEGNKKTLQEIIRNGEN